MTLIRNRLPVSISSSLSDMFSSFPLVEGINTIQMTGVSGIEKDTCEGCHPIQLVVEKIDDSFELLSYSELSIHFSKGSSTFVVSNFFDFVNERFISSTLGLCEISDDVKELFDMYLSDAISRFNCGSVKIEVRGQGFQG